MLAKYTVVTDIWTDMPEAKPRARARVKNKRPDAELTVEDDGTLTFSADADIEIDTYDGPKYKDVREEVRVSIPINATADQDAAKPHGNAPIVKPIKEDKSSSKPAVKVGKDK
jgi:hypothetical protein